MSVNFQDKDYKENIDYLELVSDLYKGTRQVKSKGRKYLSQYQLEEDEMYAERLRNATFYNFFQKSVNNLSSILLRKEPVLSDYQVKYEKLIKNVDGKGSDINQFMKEISKQAIKDGMSYIWVDSQRVDRAISLASIDSIQPFAKLIKRSDVINKSVAFEGGKAVLKQIVIKQTISVAVDEYESEDKEVYIVLRETEGLIYEEVAKNKFEIIDSWVSDLGYVPIIPVYSAKSGYLEADIPLLDLAYLNLSHYNAQSNIDSILKLASLPVPVIYTDNEFDKETLKKEGVSIGVTKALSFTDRQKEGFEFAEITGNSIDKLESNVEKIEERMEKSALSVLTSGSFNTATEAKISDSNSNMFLLELAYSLENGINAMFSVMSDYMGVKLNITVETSKDFEAIGLDAQTIDKYIMLKREGYISIETLWDELIKGEVLSIQDYELEKQKIEEETARL